MSNSPTHQNSPISSNQTESIFSSNQTAPNSSNETASNSSNQTASNSSNQTASNSSNQTASNSSNQTASNSSNQTASNSSNQTASNSSNQTASNATFTFEPIVTMIVNETIINPNFVVTNTQGITSDGGVKTNTTFTTTNPDVQMQVTKNLVQSVEIYDDEKDATLSVLNTIRQYAHEIKCEDFHGKGTIDDYKNLFIAASNIANESSQMSLDVDVDGFNEFGAAADELSALFTSFIRKLENVNIINNLAFLQSIASALQKIVNLSNVFGKFKDTIIGTSTIRIPKSMLDTKVLVNNVLDEVNCAMNYMTYFVNPVNTALPKASLSDADKSVIENAVKTIEHWNVLCDQGVSITMANDENIKAIAQTNNALKSKTNILQSITSTLRNKLTSYNL
jgi:hypothetical protein